MKLIRCFSEHNNSLLLLENTFLQIITRSVHIMTVEQNHDRRESDFTNINLQKPLQMLADWVKEARDLEMPEPDAMNLATVDSNGRPHNRMVLMRHINEREIGFFTNLASNKASEIYSNQRTSSTLWWPSLGRQVRIEGTAVEMPRDIVENYYQSRPRNSKIAAWASKQSTELVSMERLHEEFREYEAKFSGKKVPTPKFWGGFTILVDKIEYWYSKPFRMHERVILTKEENSWSRTRIYP